MHSELLVLKSKYANTKKSLVPIKKNTTVKDLNDNELASKIEERYQLAFDTTHKKVLLSHNAGVKVVETQDSLDTYIQNAALSDTLLQNASEQITNLEKQVSLKTSENAICKSLFKDVNSKLSIKDNQL